MNHSLSRSKNTAYYQSGHTFSAKEKDDETGYSYFGARYYDSELSVWLSVDPLSDEIQGISPYNYCLWNPIVRIDPDGRDGRITITENENGTGGEITIESTIYLYGKGAKEAAANANTKFAGLNNNPTTTEIDGKTYNIQMNLTYVYSEELDILGKNISEIDYDDLSKVEGFKIGDNVLQVGVPNDGGKTGKLGESQVGGTFGYSISVDANDVIHESLHLIGLDDTYSGCCTPNRGFEKDILTLGPQRGKEINQAHFREMGDMAGVLNSNGKSKLSRGFRPPDFQQLNPRKHLITYRNENPKHLKEK